MMSSKLLVGLQFLLIIAITYPVSGSMFWWQGAWVSGVGCMIGLWCLFYNRPGRFNIRPELHPDAILVITGPYRWIRHPMYTSVWLFCLGMVLVHQTLFSFISLALLIPLLWIKALREEGYLSTRFPEYISKMASVRRFIPFVL